MRTQRKMQNYSGVATIGQSYHDRETSGINYAFQGFNKNLYFSSDRPVELDEHFCFVDNPQRALKGYGLEIELACFTLNSNEALTQVLSKVCMSGLHKDLFKYQDDCTTTRSGGNCGKEAITQVMTKEFVRNSYPGFKLMYDYFDLFGIKATLSCGMHCNMSVGLFGKDTKTREEAIRKFVYFINKNYKLSCDLVKRSFSRTDWCGQMSYWTRKENAQRFNFNTLSEYSSDHGICFNIAHYPTGRIELRLVGPQPNYPAFRNTMEVIFHLVETMKNISWKDIDDMKKVFKGCNKYVLSRLKDCRNSESLSSDDYEVIKSNSDTTTNFGNY